MANTDCKSASGASWPAFLCSGILMRATGAAGAYYPWNPRPGSGEVSFSWLRQDANFRGTWDLNGFIFLPRFNADAYNDEPMYIDCAFADDAYTWIRGQGGCGATSTYPAESKPCHLVDIATAAQYQAAYQRYAWFNERICGFAMTSDHPEAMATFMQITQIMTLMGASSFNRWNEVMVREWRQNAQVPLEAFYFVSNPTVCQPQPCASWTLGLANAQADQIHFAAATGRWAPIIRIGLATSPSGTATFQFAGGDQAVTP